MSLTQWRPQNRNRICQINGGYRAMAAYDLNRSELNSLLASDNIDPSVRKSIIDYLQDDGLLTGHGSTVAVQESGYPPLDSNAQVLLVDTSPATVADPNLK